MSQTRRLAAILAADVVGHSRLMQGCPGENFGNENLYLTCRKQFEVVLRGLDLRIHVFLSAAPRRGCPRI